MQHPISVDMQEDCVLPANTVRFSHDRLFGEIRPSIEDLQLKELESSAVELPIRARKPYTITKQRERWTEEEHVKFLEAIKLHGRNWRRIQEYIGTKTAIQIRSHAQKFFTKVDREADTEKSIEIPPPRPKRKPLHPYPRKHSHLSTIRVPDLKRPGKSSSSAPSFSEQESGSPTSVLSVNGSETSGSPISKLPNSCASPSSSAVGSDLEELSFSDPENGYCSHASSNMGVHRNLSGDLASNATMELDLDLKEQISPKEQCSPVEQQLTSLKLFGRTVFVSSNSQEKCPANNGNAAECFKSGESADVCSHQEETVVDAQNGAPASIHPDHLSLCGLPRRNRTDDVGPRRNCIWVHDELELKTKAEIFSPVPSLGTLSGSPPFHFTKILSISLKQDRPHTVSVVTGKKEDSTICSSLLGSDWSKNDMVERNHTVRTRGSGIRRSQNSAFSPVKSNKKSCARGFVPYESFRSEIKSRHVKN